MPNGLQDYLRDNFDYEMVAVSVSGRRVLDQIPFADAADGIHKPLLEFLDTQDWDVNDSADSRFCYGKNNVQSSSGER